MDHAYPIGAYQAAPYSEAQKEEWIADIRFLPQAVEHVLLNLDEAQLQTPYREGGWTVHQVVHHLADSHMNAFIRFKLGLTEERPVIKPYEEKAWAETPDVQLLPHNYSITLLYALHHRWTTLLQSLDENDWQKTIIHPEHGKEWSLWYLLGMYAWHGKHHTAHIRQLCERMGW